jgi:hypothetical protein
MTKLEPLAAGAAAIEEGWGELGRAGTWWTGAERVALAAETRAARSCAICAARRAALSPRATEATHAAGRGLDAAVVDATHRLSSDPGRLTVRWLEEQVAAGVAEEAVVELVAIVSFVAMADTLDVAVGAPERALPAPAPGEPSRARPPGLEKGCAWVPTVDPARAEGPVAAVYGVIQRDAGFVFHVARALTAVPDAMQTFLRGFFAHYHTHGAPKGPLSRPQVELLAASTSSINECFY